MEIINTTGRKREKYHVKIKYSPFWECALGIAAITNKPLLDSLERPQRYWHEIKQSLSVEVREHLDYVEENNTWKALLQLLHHRDFSTLPEFTTFIQQLSSTDFKCICLPFVGMEHQATRKRAASGDPASIHELKALTVDNMFFPAYITFICSAEVQALKTHLIAVMTGWYEKVIKPEIDQLTAILQTDYEAKARMKTKMDSEELVQWATGGIHYAPEPSVHNVLLIPHFIYRPWNIEADIEGTKVFYYPVANTSISPNDPYLPSNFLVLKHKALADEVRLRIVKLLFERNHSLQDITDKLGMGKSTIHHHLKLLRSAQLVEINDATYVLKRKAVESLAKELDLYFHQ
ncbi:winged helix-turn-helix transcriptional regulator [Virgibacillus sp. NKC19-3]|uniref:ArsR/SmtB family transcription factor n=1 Tax=Virgibacillus saliphilus TaxID=2831674 RepID=UPI001C9A2D70|nr:metalloregulator ArsR/SmtB family transcription factor [Virgibacillus sp. NKC19-3]MBY7144973.1 winged helix-turn-helix transcriptional regulator [Virgibacillus sp. NKC19-3]